MLVFDKMVLAVRLLSVSVAELAASRLLVSVANMLLVLVASMLFVLDRETGAEFGAMAGLIGCTWPVLGTAEYIVDVSRSWRTLPRR